MAACEKVWVRTCVCAWKAGPVSVEASSVSGRVPVFAHACDRHLWGYLSVCLFGSDPCTPHPQVIVPQSWLTWDQAACAMVKPLHKSTDPSPSRRCDDRGHTLRPGPIRVTDCLQLFARMPFRAKRHNTGFSSYGYYEIAVSVFQRMWGEEGYIQDVISHWPIAVLSLLCTNSTTVPFTPMRERFLRPLHMRCCTWNIT